VGDGVDGVTVIVVRGAGAGRINLTSYLSSYRLFVLLRNIFFQFPADFEEKWLIGKLRSRQEHLLLRAYDTCCLVGKCGQS
jgi:hypothetical protein